MFIGEWNKSVILTYIGVCFAVLGICLAGSGAVSQAYACLIVAGVCDLFDGAVARRCERNEAQKRFGIELDSLVDVMSFLALPTAICIGMGLRQWYYIAALLLFSICGIARLAFFNAEDADSEGPVKYYTGLPVTYTALILPLAYLLKYALLEEIFPIVFAGVIVLVALLNILNVKVIKPKGIAYAFFTVLALVMLVLFLAVLP